MNEVNRRLRELPHLEAVLQSDTGRQLLEDYHRPVVLGQARLLIESLRSSLLDDSHKGPTDAESVALLLERKLMALSRPAVQRVINATGILLHTNLGRSVLNQETRAAVLEISRGYSSLEFDLESGKRGKRDKLLARQLSALTGCEDATLVNNCAAAVMITLNTMAQGREVITSRGELVEIGGSYRVPDVIPASGCQLREVGTTNRTRLDDYENAINDNSGLLLKTHASNYRVRGFTEETTISELVTLGKRHSLPVMVDLGSGYFGKQGLPVLDEPELLQCLAEGPDIVCISGDKLLGGPQAGLILGSREWIGRIRANPLWRILRLDKLLIGALSSVASQYIRNAANSPISILAQQLSLTEDELKHNAEALRKLLQAARTDWQFTVAEGTATVGGGTLPDQDFRSSVVAVEAAQLSAEHLEAQLRHASVPVIGYVSAGRLLLNVASLLDGEAEEIAAIFGELHG